MPPNSNSVTITDVLDAMQANLPNLVTGKDYLLQHLVGNTFWQSMPMGARKTLGHKFKDIVMSGGQPVKWSECKSNNSNFYQLR